MSVIWKFPVEIKDEFSIEMPAGAELLSIQAQRGEPFLWAEVNPEAELKSRKFRVFGTGQPIEVDEWIEYVGTFQMHDGALVFHLYEIEEFEEIPF